VFIVVFVAVYFVTTQSGNFWIHPTMLNVVTLSSNGRTYKRLTEE